jgi:hypothetical protein
MSHGERVVYIVDRRYTDAASRPAFERVRLPVLDGAALLHSPVVPDAEDGAVIGDQRAADRHATFVAPDARLGDGVSEELEIAVFHRFSL